MKKGMSAAGLAAAFLGLSLSKAAAG